MKQVLIQQGKVTVEDVPSPQVAPGCLLIQTDHSCISIGTELSGIRSSGTALWKKALQQPEKIRKVLDMVQSQGLSQTIQQLESKFGTPHPTGYSAAGVVLAVGQGVSEFKIGDRVACAGAQCAFHAEILSVPKNLVVTVPDSLDFSEASTVTLGAIALQGVRRLSPTMGECFVVVGLGILGQLTVQLLKAHGARVIGIDPQTDRIAKALQLGMDLSIEADCSSPPEQVIRLTGGLGADGVIITAAAQTDEILSAAFKMCRKKGRVVLVGDVGLNINRADIYEKELDFFVSTSYGPGRYDATYEEHGLDYPVGYVRWTENRNMSEYVRLLAEKRLNISSLIGAVYSIDQAPVAYEKLEGADRPLMVLLRYPREYKTIQNSTVGNFAAPKSGEKVNVALIGAGSFAKGTHLPNLKRLSNLYSLRAVMSRTGHNASNAAKQFGASYATTEFEKILSDSSVDSVIICTRHDQHAALALSALRRGKHVLLEKPLALKESEIAEIENFYSSAPARAPILLTGFNRRHSPYAKRMAQFLKARSSPAILTYRMNAGYLPANHWVHGPEGGGRNIGEACHIYDLFTFLIQAKVTVVTAQSIKPGNAHFSHSDNFVATMSFEDGSVANLIYTSMGSTSYPKEHLEIFADGQTAVMEDYRSLRFFGSKARGLETKLQEKGQKEELESFASAVMQGGEWPIPFWQQAQAMRIAFQVESFLNR